MLRIIFSDEIYHEKLLFLLTRPIFRSLPSMQSATLKNVVLVSTVDLELYVGSFCLFSQLGTCFYLRIVSEVINSGEVLSKTLNILISHEKQIIAIHLYVT